MDSAKERYSEAFSHDWRTWTWSISSTLVSWLLLSGQRRPIQGNRFARDSLECSVPKESMLMSRLTVQRSAENARARVLCITSDVGWAKARAEAVEIVQMVGFIHCYGWIRYLVRRNLLQKGKDSEVRFWFHAIRDRFPTMPSTEAFLTPLWRPSSVWHQQPKRVVIGFDEFFTTEFVWIENILETINSQKEKNRTRIYTYVNFG